MDRTWIYRTIHLIISLLLIGTSELSSKEYYCTKVGTWREAMTSCTESGGVPLSYRDVYNSTEFTLKDNRTVWTADFLYLEDVTGRTVQDLSGLVRGKMYFWEQCRSISACESKQFDQDLHCSHITYIRLLEAYVNFCEDADKRSR